MAASLRAKPVGVIVNVGSSHRVRELRERSGAGMMECKKALVEAGGDMEAAIEHMRKSGAAKADKKAARVAAEGVVRIAIEGNAAAVETILGGVILNVLHRSGGIMDRCREGIGQIPRETIIDRGKGNSGIQKGLDGVSR